MSKKLHLVVKGKWFDMIESGQKKEEYRAIKKYWGVRLHELRSCEEKEEKHKSITRTFEHNGKIYGRFPVQFESIIFHRGYTDKRYECVFEGLEVGIPKKGWIEEEFEGEEVYKLKLGEKL